MSRDYAEGKPVPDPLPVGGATAANQDQTHLLLTRLSNYPYVGTFRNLFEARFFEHDPNDTLDLNGAGTATSIPGGARFLTNNATGVTYTAVMREANRYSADHTMGYAGTIDFHVAPLGTGEYEFGPLNVARTTGVTLYQTASTIGLRRYFNSTTPVEDVDIANWNLKPGGTGIYKDDNGNDQPLDLTKRHIIRVSGKWLGSGTLLVTLEPEDGTLAPVAVHEFRFNNRSDDSSLATPNLPMQLVMRTGDTAQALQVEAGCWVVGNDGDTDIPVQSQANSTVETLAGGVFQGKAVSAIHHGYARVSVESPTTGELLVEWCDDPAFTSAVVQENLKEYDDVGATEVFHFSRRGEFVRIRYEDTGVSATDTTIRTWFVDEGPAIPTKKLKESLTQGDDMVPASAAMFGFDTSSPGGNKTNPITAGDLVEALAGSGRRVIDVRGFLYGYNGSTWDFLRSSVANGLEVDVTRSALPAGAATETTLQDLKKRAGQILKHEVDATEDLLTEEVTAGTRVTLYVAVAPTGTATSAASWEVVRRVEDIATDTDTVSMVEYRTGVAFDNRADPTADGEAAWRADWWS